MAQQREREHSMVVAARTPFGALLKRYRVAAGLSQEALAERALLSTRGISDLERGRHRLPYRDTVARLAEALALDARPAHPPRGASRQREDDAAECVARVLAGSDAAPGLGVPRRRRQ